MKLNQRQAETYFANPDPDKAGLLIYGADAMRVALRRQQVLAALLGPDADEEMRLSRMTGAALRQDPAQLLDAIKAVGFFPGPRAAFVEEAGEAAAPSIVAALAGWRPGDAQLVVTAGSLKPASKLRKAFESHNNAYAVGIYDAPPSRDEIARVLAASGLGDIPGDSLAALSDLAGDLGPGDFAQTVEKLSLYMLDQTTPVSIADIRACAPQSTEAALDDVLNVVTDGVAGEIGPLMQRLRAQGTNAVTLCIGANRHFRRLYACASASGGPSQGVSGLRPPVYGPQRDRLVRQAGAWGAERLETALGVLTDTDLRLRAANRTVPDMALVERALIRLARLAPGRS